MERGKWDSGTHRLRRAREGSIGGGRAVSTGLNLEIWFPQQTEVTVFLESSITDPEQEQFAETCLFALYAARQIANLRRDGYSLAGVLAATDTANPRRQAEERLGDVRLLADNFLHSLTEQHGGGPRCIDEAAMQRLERYGWPGNVRELGNVIQRAFLLSESTCLRIEPFELGNAGTADYGPGLDVSFRRARAKALLEFECRFVRQALAQSAGNVSLAAKRACKERRSFGRLLKKHGINRADFKAAVS